MQLNSVQSFIQNGRLSSLKSTCYGHDFQTGVSTPRRLRSKSSRTQSPRIAGDVGTGVGAPRRLCSSGAERQLPRTAFADIRPGIGTPRRLASTGTTRQTPRHVKETPWPSAIGAMVRIECWLVAACVAEGLLIALSTGAAT